MTQTSTGTTFVGELRTFTNDGAGVFNETVLENVGRHASVLSAADIDADGRLDLISSLGQTLILARIHLRRADNSGFEPVLVQVLGQRPVTDLLDADGDGDLDLVTDRVYRNRLRTPPLSGIKRQLADAITGTGSVEPVLGGEGQFQVGQSVNLRLRSARPATNGLFRGAWITQTSTPFGGGVMQRAQPQGFVSPIPLTTSGGASDALGSGTWNLPYTVPAYKAGRTYAYFVELDDWSAPSGGARSNTMLVTYGL